MLAVIQTPYIKIRVLHDDGLDVFARSGALLFLFCHVVFLLLTLPLFFWRLRKPCRAKRQINLCAHFLPVILLCDILPNHFVIRARGTTVYLYLAASLMGSRAVHRAPQHWHTGNFSTSADGEA